MSDQAEKKSCFTCPSLLTDSQSQINFLGKAVGAPVCARFGRVLGSSNSTLKEKDKIGQTYASSCSKHGEPKPTMVDWPRMTLQVAIPDVNAMTTGDARNQPDSVTSCRMCVNYIREDTVVNELGYASGTCAAKGRLILPSRLSTEATGCDYRSFGAVRTSTTGLTMLPEYTMATRGSTDPVRNHQIQKAKGFVDPTVYPTDKPVTAQDEADGIRAWREMYDPVSENSVYLPIFRADFFDETERSLIPQTGDDEHPEDFVDTHFHLYKVAVLWQELDETPGVWGQPGVGKTEMFRHLAWLMQLPFYRFNITGQTELEELRGSKEYDPERGTYWQDGRFVEAWAKPCVAVLDEPNAGRPEVWHFLRPLTDNSKQLVIEEAPVKNRKRGDFFYLGLAMNPPWDARNSGINPIADADARRLHHMFIDLPPKEIELDIIKTRVAHDGWEISTTTLETIANIAEDIRALVKEDALPISWGIAMQLKVARALRWFDWFDAYRMAAGDFLEPEAQETLIQVVKTHTEGLS
jgi:MoxR-like ATPase